MKLKGQDKWLW